MPATTLIAPLPALLFVLTADGDQYAGALPLWVIKLLIVSFLGSVALVFRLTFVRLMRVETDATNIYVSNYFSTVRYPFESVLRIEDGGFLLWRVVRIHLYEKGVFGKTITFWAGSNFQEVIAESPEFAALVR